MPVPAWPEPAVERTPRARRAVLACSVAVLLLLLATPFLPDVIRIPLPESWRVHLPRVEFVRHENDRAPAVAAVPTPLETRVAADAPALPERVPPRVAPVPAESSRAEAAPAPPTLPAVALADTAPPEREAVATHESSTAPAHVAIATQVHTHSPARATPPAAKPAPRKGPVPHPGAASATASAALAHAEPHPVKPAPPRHEPAAATHASHPSAVPTPSEPETSFVSDHPITLVPVRVETEVKLAPPREPRPADSAGSPAPAPAEAAADSTSEQDWPLLCGQVLDETGAPVEGARVVLASPSLAVRSDRRGRFCIACPAGARTLWVEAEGREPVKRVVQLVSPTVETRISLGPAH